MAAKGKTGKRYDEAKKAEVIKFIREHDAKNGRGGMSSANKKYGISMLTLSKWLDNSSRVLKGGVMGRASRLSGPKGEKANKILSRMSAILHEIEQLEREYTNLKKKL